MKSERVQNPEHVGSVKHRPPTDHHHPPTASQHGGKKQKERSFLSPLLQSDKIAVSQEKGMPIFGSFTLPDELGKSVEK